MHISYCNLLYQLNLESGQMLIKGAKILTLDANDSIHDWLLVEGSKVKQSGDGEPPIEIQAAPFLDYHGKTYINGKRFEPQSDAILPFIAKMLKRKLFG